MKQSLSILIHGHPKAGKSTLSFTAPLPILVLDAEGSTKLIRKLPDGTPVQRVYWDPTKTAPPIADGTWNVCIVQATNWQAIDFAYRHLQRGQHPFRSVSIDSITEVQRKCKENLGVSDMEQRHWGKLLEGMDKLIRGIRDLCEVPTNPLEVSVFIAETVNKDGLWRPNMQGAVSTSMPYWVDFCTFLRQDKGKDGLMYTELITAPVTGYITGRRGDNPIPAVIADPNIATIIDAVYA